jgi:hypothetical protein
MPRPMGREPTLSAYAYIPHLEHMHMLITAVKARKGERDGRQNVGDDQRDNRSDMRLDLAAGDHKSSAMTGTAAVIVDSAALPSGL